MKKIIFILAALISTSFADDTQRMVKIRHTDEVVTFDSISTTIHPKVVRMKIINSFRYKQKYSRVSKNVYTNYLDGKYITIAITLKKDEVFIDTNVGCDATNIREELSKIIED
jgi:hypothetical protein